MGTILAQAIVTRVERALFDLTNERWSEAELLEYLSDGQRQIVVLRPEANPKNMSRQLVAGTRQTIPERGYQLLDIICNMGTDGNTQGRAVRMCAKAPLDAFLPMWHASRVGTEDKTSTTVENFVYDTKDRYHFYVYPPQPSNVQGSVLLVYAETPADITSLTATIDLDDAYEPNLFHYCMYRALTKDQPGEDHDSSLADSQFRLFALSLAEEATIEKLLFPRQQEDREDR